MTRKLRRMGVLDLDSTLCQTAKWTPRNLLLVQLLIWTTQSLCEGLQQLTEIITVPDATGNMLLAGAHSTNHDRICDDERQQRHRPQVCNRIVRAQMFKLELSEQHVSIIAKALATQPYGFVTRVIAGLQNQSTHRRTKTRPGPLALNKNGKL